MARRCTVSSRQLAAWDVALRVNVVLVVCVILLLPSISTNTMPADHGMKSLSRTAHERGIHTAARRLHKYLEAWLRNAARTQTRSRSSSRERLTARLKADFSVCASSLISHGSKETMVADRESKFVGILDVLCVQILALQVAIFRTFCLEPSSEAWPTWETEVFAKSRTRLKSSRQRFGLALNQSLKLFLCMCSYSM